MVISVKLVTNFKEILNIEDTWNQQIAFSSKNPLYYSSIFCKFMNDSEKKGSIPLVITFWSENNLVGMAPLKLCKFWKFNQVCSLDNVLYSDFVLLDEHREACINQLMNTIFYELNCISAKLTLDQKSPNFELLKRKGQSYNKLTFKENPDCGRATILLDQHYESYYKSLNRKVRKQIRRLTRRYDELGTCKIFDTSVNNESITKVSYVDQKSWKAKWRKKNNLEEDTSLRIILETFTSNKEAEQKYDCKIWFLEVNDHPVAYQIVIIYDGVASFVKTSYDKKYRNFSPGFFLINEVIREMFKKGLTKIDFFTDLPFLQSWDPTTEKRTRIFFKKKSAMFSVIRFISKTSTKIQDNISLIKQKTK